MNLYRVTLQILTALTSLTIVMSVHADDTQQTPQPTQNQTYLQWKAQMDAAFDQWLASHGGNGSVTGADVDAWDENYDRQHPLPN